VGDSSQPRKRATYIVSPLYDWAFFLAPPLAALLLGYLVDLGDVGREVFSWWGQDVTLTTVMLGVFIHAHLVIVLWRSHGNADVRTQFRWRMFAAPVLLFVGMTVSLWVAVIASVLATFWDVYHSGAQTFGFARIYEVRAGNDPLEGRRRDFWINQVVYAGPIVAGATMLDHFSDFEEFEVLHAAFFTNIPMQMETHQVYFTGAILSVGAGVVVDYVWAAWRDHRAGKVVPWQKVFLLSSTSVVSIYAWGFNPWGEAFLIMNAFHALQYFGIVWATEHRNMQRTLRLHDAPGGRVLTWMAFVLGAVLYGLAVEAWGATTWWFWRITIVVSLMHFWYDGFIWSVRKTSTT
jgi:hypothetical protein